MITRNRKSVLSTVTPATGGTQSNELQAAIKSVTSSTTVGAVFLYDTSQDSDGGKWRKGNRCKGLSWFDEASSATRSARSEFPAMALIVADNAATPTVTIYDLDDVSAPMWMVFSSEASGGENHFWRYGDATSIAALNGRIIVGKTSGGGSCEFRLVEDKTWNNGTSGTNQMLGGIVDRNSGLSWGTVDASRITVNNQHNGVAMTVLEGAEIGALGLPIPTVAVACNADGISVIHPNGDVYDQKNGGGYGANQVFWGDDALYGNFVTGTARRMNRFPLSSLYADNTPGTAASQVIQMTSSGWTSVGMALGQSQDAAVAAGKDTIAQGGTSGLQILKVVPAKTVGSSASETDSAAAYITSTYNTGYMVGDIRFAGLAGNGTADEEREDRSVKGNDLAETGTIDSAAVATGAELYGYSGFTASDYLSRANDTDFDFGTGDFSIMFWHKLTQTSVDSTSNPTQYEDTISRTDATSEAGDWLIQKQPDESLLWKRHDGSSWASIKTSSASKVGTEWTLVCAVRRSGVFNWYYNGVYDSSVADTNSYTPSGGSALVIGRRLDASYPATGASLSLLRISATAPTPKQIADIYAAEKPLFAANAKCLLQASGYTDVLDLGYDKSTGLLTVGQTSGSTNGATIFRGLEAVDTFSGYTTSGWSAGTTSIIAAAGGVSSYSRTTGTGGTTIDLPSIDARAELNEGESKIPDDGKFHFSGVTTDATQTTIGNIPISIGDKSVVTATVTGYVYGVHNLSWDYGQNTTILTREFHRAVGGNVATFPAMSKLERNSSGTTGVDVVAEGDTAAQTAAIKVTGVAGTRIVWKAEVEVQRISEKLYER